MLSESYKELPTGVWARDEDFSFAYSDGDEVEQRILKNVQDADDVSVASDELQALMIDWPSEYHFSPLRANLLSSFHLQSFKNILEIGCGCGAITRGLAEQCPGSQIVALDGSMRRAEISRARCRDLANVTVCRDSFADFEHDGSFDLITLIGVLEYSPSFFKGDDPVAAAIERARRLLSPNGLLIVAMENQLGLKYFNGCGEDHNGQPFFGIDDRYQPGTFCTFGRKELQKKLQDSGFANTEFVYPFPDYKLPRLLLREEAFSCDCFAVAPLLGQYPSRDYSREVDPLFQESRTWSLLARNGMAQDMANSFLLFAFAGDKSLADISDSWLSKAFSCMRKKRYLIETVFSRKEDTVLVKKALSYPQENGNGKDEIAGSIRQRLETDPYINGTPYFDSLLLTVRDCDSAESLARYLTPWMDWLKNEIVSSPEEELIPFVPGSLYDCIPANCIIDNEGKLHVIDQEWEAANRLELGFLLFRALYSELGKNMKYWSQSALFDGGTAYELLLKIFPLFQLPFDETILKKYVSLEVEFQLHLVVYSVERDQLYESLLGFFQEQRTRCTPLSDLLITGGMQRYDLALADVARLENTVKERGDMLHAVLESRSWKITGLLRGLGTVLKKLKRTAP